MVWFHNINLMRLIKIPYKPTLLRTVKTCQLKKRNGSIKDFNFFLRSSIVILFF